MVIVRAIWRGSQRYGILDDAQVRLIEAAPWDGPVEETGEIVELAELTLLPPADPPRIFAVGRNYRAHTEEMGMEVPTEPAVFLKPITSLVPSGGTVVLPATDLSSDVEHEAELAVVIGSEAANVSPASALDHVFGYTCANDVSARDIQRSDTHITRAKGFDTFCPLGPAIVTGLDPGALRIECRVNGEVRQQAPTSDMVFDVAAIVSSLSRWTKLQPGDVILTGSPSGTGPLADGDQVEIEITGIGVLKHDVVAFR